MILGPSLVWTKVRLHLNSVLQPPLVWAKVHVSVTCWAVLLGPVVIKVPVWAIEVLGPLVLVRARVKFSRRLAPRGLSVNVPPQMLAVVL